VYAGGYPFALRDYKRYARSVTRDDAPLYLCVACVACVCACVDVGIAAASALMCA
jgi:hypothetical protein